MGMNLDVLEHILGRLCPADLAACALVSRTFLAAALPALYRNIEYTVHHAKRSNTVASPFATLAAHEHLVVHVRRIAIHAGPVVNNVISPTFLNHLSQSLRTATNLRGFVCTVKIMPALLPFLADKHRLHHLRTNADLGSRQCALLQKVSVLRSLSLDYPSWIVIDALPNWCTSMHHTLAHLTLFMSQDLDATSLNAILARLPRLRGLHVIGCPRITHNSMLRALFHTPDLLELSMTVFPSPDGILPHVNFIIPPLTHLSLDVRTSYPGLQPLISRIISRLCPRYALAICGEWIGEISGSSEAPVITPGGATNIPAPVQVGGAAQPHNAPAHNHHDPPLLSPPQPYPQPIHNHDHQPPIPALPFPFDYPPGNNNGNNNNNDVPATAPNPISIDPLTPSIIDSLPSTLSVVHLPLLSPSALREIVERCESIQTLGIIIGSSFTSKASVRSGKATSRAASRSAARLKHAVVNGVRPEISELANILSRARALRELIIDVDNINLGGTEADPHGVFKGPMLLTPSSVRTLMRESPLLRRVVGEGRVWESSTPTPSFPVPFPQCLDIELTLSRARYGLGMINHHGYGPPGLGSPGGGYSQLEVENDHWFWLTGSASGGKPCSGF